MSSLRLLKNICQQNEEERPMTEKKALGETLDGGIAEFYERKVTSQDVY